jgi:predicted amidohydrolase
MPALHVAAAHILSRAMDTDANFARLQRQVESAAVLGVQAMLFAETSLHSYDLAADSMAQAEPLGGPLTTRLADLARRHHMTIMAGFWEQDGDRRYNSHAIAHPRGELQVQRKHVLTPKELAAGLTQGPIARTLVELNGIRTALIICADSGCKELPNWCRDAGVRYRFCPTAGGDMINNKKMRYLHEAELAEQEARDWLLANRHHTFIADAILDPGPWSTGFTSANAMGPDGRGTTHQGHCIITDNHHVMRAQLPGSIILEHQQDALIHAVLQIG